MVTWHQQIGFSNMDWHELVSRLQNPPQESEWLRKMVNSTVRRYKAHAEISLLPPKSRSLYEKVDHDFLRSVEDECPVDDLFRNEFRYWVIAPVDPFDNKGGHKEAVQRECLFNACWRLLIRLMPEHARIDRIMPHRPLYCLQDHPFKSRIKNEVHIVEVHKIYPLVLRNDPVAGDNCDIDKPINTDQASFFDERMPPDDLSDFAGGD